MKGKLGGVKEGKLVNIYCMREESMFNKKEGKEKEKRAKSKRFIFPTKLPSDLSWHFKIFAIIKVNICIYLMV